MKNPIRQLNLELGYPTVDQALSRLQAEIEAQKHMKQPVLKIIHGYGSGGKGGKIRTACRKYLKDARAAGRITAWLPGERFSIFEEDARSMIARCPALRDDPDREQYNNGITYVVL